MKKLKVLVSAYACSPNHGSEPGMGWNFVLGLSKFHEVHVIAEKRKWEVPVITFLKQHSDLNQNLKFHFIDKKRNKRLRKIWPPSYYWFYKKWQKEAYHLAMLLNSKEKFDIIHQLNMVGYREPGYLWKIKKPFVWGPIGGLENSPWHFLPALGLKGLIYYTGRNLINSWQRNFGIRPRLAANRNNNFLLAATSGNAVLIKQFWQRNAMVMCEVGQVKMNVIMPNIRKSSEPLKVIWSGVHTPGKNLPLLLRSLVSISFPYELHILGKGLMTAKWKKLSKSLGLWNNIIWHHWVKHPEAVDIMRGGHIFCITSIKDLTSTVTLEALSSGLPIICLDHFGFADVVTEKCGIKIKLTSPKKAVKNIAAALKILYDDENLRQNLSNGAIERVKDYSWDKKIEELNSVYLSLLDSKIK